MSASRIINYGSIFTKTKAPVDFVVGPPAPSDLQHRFFRGPVGSAGLTDVDRNFGSSLALAAHLGLRLLQGYTPSSGSVCIALVLLHEVDSNATSMLEDRAVALTTMLEVWLGKPNH